MEAAQPFVPIEIEAHHYSGHSTPMHTTPGRLDVANIQKLGGLAAVLNAVVAVAMLVVAIVLIGPSTLAHPGKLVDLAIHNPTPLIIQDALKFALAALASVLILALANRLRGHTPTLILVATIFGFLSVLGLVANAALSLYAISQAASSAPGASAVGNQLNGLIGVLALAVIVLNGVWYFLVSWSALKSHRLPQPLSYLGLGMGILSFAPPLGIIVLLLSTIWSLWLGQLLLKEGRAG